MCSQDRDGAGRKESLELIGRELCELASHIHAATCRWLGLVAEFDARRGWADWGCRSCAHWISWRCSIAPVAAREHVRVAHRLTELPRVRAAFAEGRLSYSKVRALTRVQGVEHEEELVRLACCATAAQLERIVRAYRGVVAVERAAAGGGADRWVRWRHDDDGALVLQARLPAEEGAVVIEAIEAAMDRLAGTADAVGAGEPPAADGPTGSASAEAVGSGEPPGADGPVRSASAEALPVEAGPTLGECRADGLLLMADALLAGDSAVRGGDRHQVVVHVDAATLVTGEGRAELDDGTPIAAAAAGRLACDAAIVPLLERAGRPLSVGRKTRAVPSALRRALSSRDRGCRFPGCDRRRRLHAHHVEHWAHGGETSLDNLVELCPHHHRLLHEGGYEMRRTRGGGFAFRRPDGRAVPDVPRPSPGRISELRARQRGVRPEACVPGWAGERLDLDLATDAMLHFAPIPEAVGI
jgi:hypothetical protein